MNLVYSILLLLLLFFPPKISKSYSPTHPLLSYPHNYQHTIKYLIHTGKQEKVAHVCSAAMSSHFNGSSSFL